MTMTDTSTTLNPAVADRPINRLKRAVKNDGTIALVATAPACCRGCAGADEERAVEGTPFLIVWRYDGQSNGRDPIFQGATFESGAQSYVSWDTNGAPHAESLVAMHRLLVSALDDIADVTFPKHDDMSFIITLR
jgi:hypothetical protein